MIALLAVLACTPPTCEEGTIRDGDQCVPYEPTEPVTHTGVSLPNGLTWQWQLQGAIDTSIAVDAYDIDLFDPPDATFQTLKADGRMVICYFSAGSVEDWRDDADRFPDEAIGRNLDGWPGEKWVDPMHPEVRAIMTDRLDHAVARGCDAVEPDNVTAWSANTGLGVNATEQLDYNRFLADEAHARGLAIALKNDGEQIPDLVDWFDFAVNEECADYDECDTNRPFVEADKAVLHAEYVDDWADRQAKADEVCGVEPGLSTIIKTWDLGAEFLACP